MTSAKPGNGVELLRDNNLDTYWQSDGAQPHLVNVQFQRKVRIRELALYADYKLDESYTPSKISVRAGNSFHDLREIKVVDLNEPVGWTRVRLDAGALGEDAEGDGGGGEIERPWGVAGAGGEPPRVLPPARGSQQPPEREGHARAPGENIRAEDEPDGHHR